MSTLAEADNANEARTVTVHGSAAGFAQTVFVRQHRIASDEPTSAGGTDTGPNPYDLLLAALGSCISMTVAMYARRKRWPLESVTVRLRYSKIHAADDIDCHIELTGDLLDEAQHARLLEIADRCPVHRTLTSRITIDIHGARPNHPLDRPTAGRDARNDKWGNTTESI